ncbi:MAG: OmpA family protein, partial [Thiothrix sp.]
SKTLFRSLYTLQHDHGDTCQDRQQAALHSCPADNTHLSERATAMNSQVSALAEVAQHFAQLRQQFANVDSERQQRAAETQRLHNLQEQPVSNLAATNQDIKPPPAARNTAKDEDNDGVPDTADLCTDTAANTTVNALGCAKNARITLKGVNFEKGAAILTAASLPVLAKVANTLKQHTDLNIEVGGHTDSSGDAATNQKLSQARAERVMQYLIDKGIPAAFLSAKGYGATVPLADNSTATGQAQNRRVELRILP